ncbi:MAG: septum formation initiator family protein [Patescibacteria group bacterium]
MIKTASRKRRAALILVLFCLGIFGVGTRLVIETMRKRSIEHQIGSLQTEADRLEAKRREILEMSERVTSQSFLEREARLRLGLQRPGEKTVIVEKVPTTREEGEEARRANNFFKWWLYFFGTKE